MICGTKSSLPSTPSVLRVAGSCLKQGAEQSALPHVVGTPLRATHVTHQLPMSPICSPPPAALTWFTLSFPAAGTFSQLSQLLMILGGKCVWGFLEPSFVWLLNLEGRGG